MFALFDSAQDAAIVTGSEAADPEQDDSLACLLVAHIGYFNLASDWFD